MYRIKLNGCIQLSRGWLTLEGMRWRGNKAKE
jgi:hypothetical protein